MTDVVETLLGWAERLCEATTGEDADLRAALAAPVDPPPFGSSAVHISGGWIPSVEVTFPPGVLTLADVERGFGPGDSIPRVHYDSPHTLAHGSVSVQGAPWTCAVFSRYANDPVAGAAVASVLLRLDPNRP